MKTFFFCGLLLSISVLSFAAVANEGSINHLQLKILKTSPSGIVTLQILNPSNTPTRIWKESNSWGAAHWRILLLRKGQLSTFFQNPDEGFTKNNPALDEIAAGARMGKSLNLNGGNWRGLNARKIEFESGDTVIAIYDVPKIFESPCDQENVEVRNMGVWYGVAAASATVP